MRLNRNKYVPIGMLFLALAIILKIKGIYGQNNLQRRVMGEDKLALYYIDAPDLQTMINDGLEEVHYDLWAKILTDDEYEEIVKGMNITTR